MYGPNVAHLIQLHSGICISASYSNLCSQKRQINVFEGLHCLQRQPWGNCSGGGVFTGEEWFSCL